MASKHLLGNQCENCHGPGSRHIQLIEDGEEEEAKKLEVEKSTREDLYPNVNARYMYVVTTKDIKSGDEITANYNLYTYPKTGIGLQMI
mgnify:CR=1 FL=1